MQTVHLACFKDLKESVGIVLFAVEPVVPQVAPEAHWHSIVDVFDEDEEIQIYAEMPGVSQGDIKLDLKEDILDISAEAGERKYHKEVLLPSAVQAETMTSNYNNGILEIKVKK